MKYTTKIQERKRGGKKGGDYKQRYVFLPQTAPFKKSEKVKVEVKKDE